MEHSPSLYETLLQNFSGEVSIDAVDEQDLPMLSVLDNLQRILNTRAGAISHLPSYGLPDMSEIFQGLPGTAHSLIDALRSTLLTHEPRLARLEVELLSGRHPGYLEYALNIQLKSGVLARLGTMLGPQGRAVVRRYRA